MAIDYQRTHEQIEQAYNWHDIAARVENVYDKITIEHYGEDLIKSSQE